MQNKKRFLNFDFDLTSQLSQFCNLQTVVKNVETKKACIPIASQSIIALFHNYQSDHNYAVSRYKPYRQSSIDFHILKLFIGSKFLPTTVCPFLERSCTVFSSFKIVIIFNNTSTEIKAKSADVLLKIITILKKLRIVQLCSKNEQTS